MSNSTRLWTRQFTAIVVMAFLFFLCIQLLTAGFPAYITDIKSSSAQGGLMTTTFMLAAIATRPIIGFLIHKVPIKIIIIYSLIFITITIGLSYNQNSIIVLIVLRVLHGIGFGIISTILSTMATTIIPIKRLGEGVGYYGMATSVGTSIAPMFAIAFLQFYSYNLLIIISVLLTIAALIIGIFVKTPEIGFTTHQANIKKSSFKEYAFDKKALLPCLLAAFFTITLGGVISFLRELGIEANIEGSVSLFFLVMAIVMISVRPFSGKIFDRFGHIVIIYPATICGMIGLFLLSITQNTLTLLLAGIFYGIAYGTLTPTFQALAVSFVSKEKQGTANAMYFSAMDLGMAIGSIGLGVLASKTSYHFIYSLSILSFIGLLIIYTITFLKSKQTSIKLETKKQGV